MNKLAGFLRMICCKFKYAFQGLRHGLRYDRSIRIQFGCAAIAVAIGLLMGFTPEEMAIVMAFCAIIIGLEFTNSTVERIMNLENPEISRSVKHIKDMAAAGVLVAAMFALAVGIMFFLRHI